MAGILSLVVLAIALAVGYVWLQSDKEAFDQETRRKGRRKLLKPSRLKHYVRLTQKRPPEDLKVKVAESEMLERALWKLVEYIIRDYIEWWYNAISKSPDFTNDIRHLFEQILAKLVAGLKEVEWGELLQEFLIELRKMMKCYRVTEISLEKRIGNFSKLDMHERQRLILRDMYENYELHVAVVGSHVAVVGSHRVYLRHVIEIVLKDVLKSRDLACKPLVSLVREILATKVLGPVMWYANSDYINTSIVRACRKAGITADDEGAAAAAAAAFAEAEAEAVRAWGTARPTPSQVGTPKSQEIEIEEVDGEGEEEESAHPETPIRNNEDKALHASVPDQTSKTQPKSRTPTIGAPTKKSAPSPTASAQPSPVLSDENFDLFSSETTFDGKKGRTVSIGGQPDIEDRYRQWCEHKKKTLRGGGVIPSPSPIKPGDFPKANNVIPTNLNRDNRYSGTDPSKKSPESHNKSSYVPATVVSKESTVEEASRVRESSYSRLSESSRRMGSTSVDSTSTLEPRLRSRSGARTSLFEALGSREFRSSRMTVTREGRLVLKIVKCIKAETPKPHVRYNILCRNGRYIKWTVEKRYNEFHDLHRTLKKQHPDGGHNTTWAHKFPKKSILSAFTQNHMDDTFIDERARKLQEYMDSCCADAAVLGSASFREFIIPTVQTESSPGDSGRGSKKADEKSKGEWEQGSKKRKELLGHIYGLIDEIFELTRHGWLRKQVVWTAKQLLGMFYNSSLYSTVDSTMNKYTSEETLIGAVNGLVNMMWPNGTLYYSAEDYKEWVPPTLDEQTETQRKAVELLVLAIDAYVPMLGKDYCMKGAVKFLEFLQVDAVVQHLGYFLLEKLFSRVFPESNAEFAKVHVKLASLNKRKRNETRKKAEQAKAQSNRSSLMFRESRESSIV